MTDEEFLGIFTRRALEVAPREAFIAPARCSPRVVARFMRIMKSVGLAPRVTKSGAIRLMEDFHIVRDESLKGESFMFEGL